MILRYMVYHGDSEHALKRLPGNSVHLVVSSPPYATMRDEISWKSLDEYWDKMERIMREVFRVVKPGRVVAINMSDYIIDGERLDLIFGWHSLLKKVGFKYRDIIIWRKTGELATISAGKMASNFIKHKLPMYWDPDRVMEAILIFTKGKRVIPKYNEYITEMSRVDVSKVKDFLKNVWEFAPRQDKEHPAVFPLELPYRLIQFYSYVGETVLDPFAGCYDDKTYIMTEHGLKPFSELTLDDKVMTIEKGRVVYRKPIRLYKYYYEGPMVRVKSRNIDLLVTPDHNMYARELHSMHYKFVKAVALKNYVHWYFNPRINWEGHEKREFVLPASGGHRAMAIDMDVWLRFLGWFISEGYTVSSKYQVCIKQSKPEYVSEIRCTLSKMPFSFDEAVYEYEEYLPSTRFRIHNKQLYNYLSKLGKAHDKHIPHEFLMLSRRQLNILLDALVKGDGTVGENGRVIYWTTSHRLAHDVFELMLKCGYAASISTRKMKVGKIGNRTIRPTREVLYEIRGGTRRESKIDSKKHISVEMYRGYVYCCEVPSHILYVVRNGHGCWCGNTGTTGKAAKMLNRSAILCEMEERYVQRIKREIGWGEASLGEFVYEYRLEEV